MENHDLDPKIYDLLVEAGIIDSKRLRRPTEEYVASSDSFYPKPTKIQQHEVHIVYELKAMKQFALWVLVITISIVLGIGLVYLLT